MEALKFVVAPFLLGYFIGGIPFGFILVYAIKGVDVRKYGSGNIGATNVMRVAGFRWGVMAFVLDVAKGGLPVWLMLRWTHEPIIACCTGAGAIVGHAFPIYLKLRGGRGVATGLGVFIPLAPIAAGIAFGVWVAVLAAVRIVSVASMIAAVSMPIVLFLMQRELTSVLVLAIFGAVFVICRHIPNIKRLVKGEEPKIEHRSN